jgi:hypothetical protein
MSADNGFKQSKFPVVQTVVFFGGRSNIKVGWVMLMLDNVGTS